ncbi:hypothetical protein KKA27_03135 [Patescibacteria group bacterium]|nr:hypothetical protein [Patescibacteria group bacterium]MBU2632888.1 hypothetical protein [Patescibacteria group bacterium]
MSILNKISGLFGTKNEDDGVVGEPEPMGDVVDTPIEETTPAPEITPEPDIVMPEPEEENKEEGMPL